MVAQVEGELEKVGKGQGQQQRFNDFLIDPNLGKIYLSMTN